MSDDLESVLAPLRAEYQARLAAEVKLRRDAATYHLIEIARQRERDWHAYDGQVGELPDSPEVWHARLEGYRLGLQDGLALASSRGDSDSPADCTPACQWARIARAARSGRG